MEKMGALMQEHMKGSFSDLLDMKILEYRPGYCKSRFNIKPEYRNPLGSVHGGLLFTIADTTAGVSSVVMGEKYTVTTIDGNMQFLNAVIGQDYVYARANVLKSGKRVVYAEVFIEGEDGTLYAKGSFTFAKIVLDHVKIPEGK